MAFKPYVPTPQQWAAGEFLLNMNLRGDVSGIYNLIAYPPSFIGSQTLAPQTIASGGATVILDTFLLDSLNGQSGGFYYFQLPGWYLCEGSVPFAGTTAETATTLTGLSNGGAYGPVLGERTRMSGGFLVSPTTSLLVRAVQIGTDYVALGAYQDTGATLNTVINTGTSSQYWSPWMRVTWVGNASGTLASAPVNPGWPSPYTYLTAGIAAGATSISVGNATGMVAGAVLGLDRSNGWAEQVTISSVSGNTVGISAATYAHAAGSAVSVPISATFINNYVSDNVNFLSYPPMFFAQDTSNSQTLASAAALPATGTALTLGTVNLDNYSGWNGTTTYTIQQPGLYWVYGQMAFTSKTTSLQHGCGITVTSANYGGGVATTLWNGTLASVASAASQNVASFRKMLRFQVGDTVQVAGFQNDSGANAVTLSPSALTPSSLMLVWRSL